MAAVLFDIHEAVKELQDAGVEPVAAEAVVRTVRRGLGENNVATKHDIAALDTRITETKAEIRAEISSLEARLTWRLLGGVALLPTIHLALLELL